MFLDAWDTPVMVTNLPEGTSEELALSFEQSTLKPTKEQVTELIDYKGEGPGPGAYTVSSGFGATPMNPIARHGGSFSFGGRSKCQGWLRPAKSSKVGPTHYDPSPE